MIKMDPIDTVTAEIKLQNAKLCDSYKTYCQSDSQSSCLREAYEEVFTEDCTIMMPGTNILHGEEGKDTVAKGLASLGLAEVVIETEEVQPLGSGDVYCETGYNKEIRKDGSKKRNKYVTLWKKVDGKYKALFLMFNAAPSE